PSRANKFDLPLDGLAGILVAARAVPGDEQRGLAGLWSARRGMLFDDVARAGQQHLRHAVVRADWTAVVERLAAALLHAREVRLVVRAQAEFTRDDFLGEVSFADEQRHNE